jgi:hypothetical protein
MYLRVKNVSGGNLTLYDLDDEENKEPNRKVQTYLDEGEVADLPMDADVMHSYEQGTIDYFVSDGKLEASPFQAQRSELWVGPEGNDDNPGTENAPLGSIQTAIDRLGEKLGMNDHKRVVVKVGTYHENFIINIPHLEVISEVNWSGRDLSESGSIEDAGPKAVHIKPDNDDRPVCVVTNMSKSGYDKYEQGGGVDYNWSSPHQFSYTGASLADRETSGIEKQSLTSRVHMHTRFTGITFGGFELQTNATPIGVLCLGVPQDGDDGAFLRSILFDSCAIEVDQDMGDTLFVKNVRDIEFRRVRLIGDKHVLDRANGIALTTNGNSLVGGAGASRYVNGNFIVHGDSNTTSDQGGIGLSSTITSFSVDPSPKYSNIYLVDEVSISARSGHSWIASGPDHELGVHSEVELTNGPGRVSISTGNYIGGGEQIEKYLDLYCGDGTYTGTGYIDANHIAANGTFTISSGTEHIIRSGTVDEDLIIEGGSTATLRNLNVKGDLIIRDSGTQVDAEGVHVQGAVQKEDSVDTTQNFYGGHIIGEGYTNPIRDENGNDATTSNWNRVQGS